MNKSDYVCSIKPSDVLRTAARWIEQDRCVGCCTAIKWQDGVPLAIRERAYELFSSLYKPYGHLMYGFWFHDGPWEDSKPEHREHRIIALLLTADMAESVGE